MRERGQSLEAFDALPRRIFLDSSTLQTLHTYGGFIFENEEPPQGDRTYHIPEHFAEIDALRFIFFVNERAGFEFALSGNSLREVAGSRDPRYLQWAYDVLDHWEACLEGYDESAFTGEGHVRAALLDSNTFGYLSTKDRLLLHDAIVLECDTFLTMERRLPKNAVHIQQKLAIRVLRPSQYWGLLQPWATLYS